MEIPVAVVCDRGRQNVELMSTARRGYFEEHRLGTCVTYTQHSRPIPTEHSRPIPTGGGD